ncbi:MAG: SsrA-binding protein [Candidatus Yanofskybacteria bacterium GW2011_GWD2_39_48]|uniref:SsrA-binding protein n=1 Tax=Candidatus Yanofskybacteria bacterium GW2011_GWD2_39_48 TaxID=1619031 RepID=A0A0G0RK63_9BACT|nr:MAG: SsrA-binding protein [Candidatus Yanofskybacteria bacterium GW2011_GWD2_39_48]
MVRQHYQPANMIGHYDPEASRKLLLSKSQISTLIGLSQSQGLTLIPLKIYDKKGHLKMLLGIAKGKKKYDKRESIKKKDIARAKQRGIDPD